MALTELHVPAPLPIPVGHQIEVRVFAVEEGLFNKAWVPQLGDPVITDRTTGVVYGSGWHFQEIGMYRSGEVRPDLPMEVRADLREHARLTGRVMACRIAWIGSGDSRYPQTTLLIETS